jgi:eukaryotic-like serine/threonine-protein kinase
MNDSNASADRLIEIFNQAKMLRAGEERAHFLAEACGADANLRAEVDELLCAHDQATGFLNVTAEMSPELEAEFARLKPEETGDHIGLYKLREKIGEGGFGTVWVAEQELPVRRRVALKILKAGMDTMEVIARFEQERQALAMMDHPNIATVFDAGATQYGRPFFVMELVRGVKITEYCDQQQLTTSERIELFIAVCHAVQHAHQKGIIHRDLKPSNILVTVNDGAAVPKVIDFGVAKATAGRIADHTVYTQFQQMIGTPIYMSPEQAEMTSVDIDTRSDIYSLGVLLYELLTGHTPIEQDTIARIGLDEIRRIIREVDPPRPSMRVKTLAPDELTTAAKRRHTDPAKLPGALRGDIDWIVMKCLEKDRKRRYGTTSGLALDLQRHLANEVVTARPPTTSYLLSRLIRRNKLAFGAAAGIATALVIGIVVSVGQMLRAIRAEQQTSATLDELRATAPAFAEQARALAAKERFDEAIEKLDYAVKLRPESAEYLVAIGDLQQCQSKLAEAAVTYRKALQVKPGHARAEASAKLCDELLAAKPTEQGKLTRESLAKLHLAMQRQQRPAAELMPVARLLGEEKKLLLEYWQARFKELPVSGDMSLEKRLTMREDGWLALDLSNTKIIDLSPLAGATLVMNEPAGEVFEVRGEIELLGDKIHVPGGFAIGQPAIDRDDWVGIQIRRFPTGGTSVLFTTERYGAGGFWRKTSLKRRSRVHLRVIGNRCLLNIDGEIAINQRIEDPSATNANSRFALLATGSDDKAIVRWQSLEWRRP